MVMITRILLAPMYVQNSITMPNLAVIQLMRVISDPIGSCVNKNVRGNKRFYSMAKSDDDHNSKFQMRKEAISSAVGSLRKY